MTWQYLPMDWAETLVGAAAALAGVSLQHVFTWLSDRRQFVRAEAVRRRDEHHAVLVRLVKQARLTQRAIVDVSARPNDAAARGNLSKEIDRLSETVAEIRFIVTDTTVVAAAESFEEQAKQLEGDRDFRDKHRLQLTPLLGVLQNYEANWMAGPLDA